MSVGERGAYGDVKLDSGSFRNTYSRAAPATPSGEVPVKQFTAVSGSRRVRADISWYWFQL